MPSNISLVTGAAGFIGAHLVDHLLQRGERVHALVRPTTRLDRLLPLLPRITLHRVDLADAPALQDCLSRVSPARVYHLAAQTRPDATCPFTAVRSATQANLAATLNLVEALAGLPAPPRVLVRAATLAEYGSLTGASHEGDAARPATAYGAGMLATTAALHVLAPGLPFAVVSARLALCYGPGQSRQFLVAQAIEALLARRPVDLANPDSRRDLMHVGDAVAGLVKIADVVPVDCPVLNIGTGRAPRMEDVLTTICDLIGLPRDFVRQTPEATVQGPSHLQMSPDLAWQRLGWRSAIDLEDGLARTIAAERRVREALAMGAAS